MPVETEALPAKARVRQGEIPIFQRIKARNLYLNQCLPYRAISEATGLAVPTLTSLAHREGWTALRRAAKERLLKAADARTQAMQNEVIETIASISEQHAIQALQKTGEALERNDRDAARDSQSYSAAAKNLVGIAKAIREPLGQDADSRADLTVFILRAGEQVKPREEKVVQEIAAKPI